ncbi:hypothetical protein [Streptomyces sp. NPDC052015]|uniref:hypothetical protein n=1 Tax=Streptomyces sp. NPDC052015 TaxID=3154755 RepID=UPI0034393FF2
MTTDYAELWKALNPRQQFYLKTIFEEDQGREAAQRRAAGRGKSHRAFSHPGSLTGTDDTVNGCR